ncbi:MAG: beta-lactamase family protein [Candidatus Hydrogenedentes bacterium]|nr:beta-lactamase family protein [Candidatus Hydrogenedentota bacterium]
MTSAEDDSTERAAPSNQTAEEPHVRAIRGDLFCLLAGALVAFSAVSCTTYSQMFRHGPSGVRDYRIFNSKTIKCGPAPFQFATSSQVATVPARVSFGDKKDADLDDVLERSNSLAFLVVHNGQIVLERYFAGHSRDSISLAFSMSKSVVSILVGCAIDDGLIGSIDDPVTKYVPELAGRGFEQVTLKHLLQMTSGLDYVEADNPFGLHSRLYYCESCIQDSVSHFRLAETPGTRFIYKSGDNILLAAVLRRALKTENISAYLERRVWKPVHMEHDALWITDGDVEKTWCGLAATARDFAKLGMLYLMDGEWEGQRIVSADWVQHARSIDESDGASWEYQFQWWRPFRDRTHFMMAGHLGQYVYVNPDTNTVVVRLGLNTGGMNFETWQSLLAAVSDGVH